MNKEEYVDFDTAKLLKEKGFDWKTDFVWYEHLPPSIDWRNKANQQAMDYFYFNETIEHHSYYRNCDKKPSYISGDIYSAPTQQMACRWLYEEKGFYIAILPCEKGFYAMIYHTGVSRHLEYLSLVQDKEHDNPTPQQAIESALQYCLTKLI